ncbi:hypothetical protein BESB_013790 [Besnoitia besnoiti]|uniref:Uncharacterized protein n=1 Tax=Besnoitia besnoiti TaxID=94643 RepID=A0A2A9MAW2_BESBE|nr:hypothetical protein BESB_013790 [Besnoitia besnoiti]PFH32767.1 hypothetical protein BESB_013790 [Besnoitia besnoiti]
MQSAIVISSFTSSRLRLALCVSAARGFGLVSLTLRPDARPLSPREHTSAQATGPSTSAYALLKDHHADALRVFVSFSSPKFNLQALASLAHLPPPQRERRLAALLRLRQHVRARVRATDERGLSVELKVLFDGTQEELTVS